MIWKLGIIAGIGEVVFEQVTDAPIGPVEIRHMTLLSQKPIGNGKVAVVPVPWPFEQSGAIRSPIQLDRTQLVLSGEADERLVAECRAAWGLDLVVRPRAPVVAMPGRGPNGR